MVQEGSGPFAGCLTERPRSSCVLVGLPDDSQSSYATGCAGGPTAVRASYNGACYNSTTELGVDLTGAIEDGGDWSPGQDWATSAGEYRRRTAALLDAGKVPFFIGGDHAVTVPVLSAYAGRGRLHVIQIDAHSDLYPELDGNPDSHACVAARLLEMEHVASVTQIGVRTLNQAQREVAEQHPDRVRIVTARQVMDGPLPIPDNLRGARVFVTVDLDGLDPAFAPGVSHPVPGGLSVRQVLDLIQRAPFDWAGMDVVELNPERDEHGRTAVLAGRLLHEAMGRVVGAERGQDH